MFAEKEATTESQQNKCSCVTKNTADSPVGPFPTEPCWPMCIAFQRRKTFGMKAGFVIHRTRKEFAPLLDTFLDTYP